MFMAVKCDLFLHADETCLLFQSKNVKDIEKGLKNVTDIEKYLYYI